jgi:Tfp pilus assembly protein PilE
MRNHQNFSGFTLIELMILLSLVALLVAVIAPACEDRNRRNKGDLCAYDSKEQFIDFLAGVSSGTAFTATLAGNSYVLILSESAILLGTAPAVAPAVTLASVSVSAAYIALKTFCSPIGDSDVIPTWHRKAVDKTSKGMEVVIDKYGEIVGFVSDKMG